MFMRNLNHLTQFVIKMALLGFMIVLVSNKTGLSHFIPDAYALSKIKIAEPKVELKQSLSFKNGFQHSQLWERVRKNYHMSGNKGKTGQQRIQPFLEQYKNAEKQLNNMSFKASPYLYYIVDQLEKRKMPGELALLPMIESAFEPQGTSNKGAAGLWQFMPKTGKYYGLKQDKWYDGRRDIEASTKAALDYLEILHKKFDKNWMLALAAYNYGEGNVEKAIKNNKRKGKSTEYWSLDLPRETKDYVPKFLALAEVVGNPKKYDIDLPTIENKPYFMQVDPGKAIDFNKVAKLADVDVKEVKRLNPGYRLSTTHPKGPQQLLLPVENAEKLIRNLDK